MVGGIAVEALEQDPDSDSAGSSFAAEAAMLAAVEEVAILFGQVVAMVVAVEYELHTVHYSKIDSDILHDGNLVFATSIGLDFEERERLGCVRCRRD